MKSPGTKFHALRVKGRKLAAEVLAAAQQAVHARGDDAVTDHAIGKRWGVARKDDCDHKPISHRAIAALFDPESGHAMAFGDVLALPRELAREALVRAMVSLEDVAGPGTRDTLDGITVQLGVATDVWRRDLADGTEDEHEKHAANFARIMTIAARGMLASQRKGGR